MSYPPIAPQPSAKSGAAGGAGAGERKPSRLKLLRATLDGLFNRGASGDSNAADTINRQGLAPIGNGLTVRTQPGVDGRPMTLAPPLTPDAQERPDITIRPDDIEGADQSKRNPEEPEERVVDYVVNCWQRSRLKRKSRAHRWKLARRYDMGDQWLVIEDARGVIDAQTAEEVARNFTVNLISPIIQKLVAMVTQSKPDAAPEPLTGSDLDIEAATEAGAWLAHLSRLNKDQLLMSTQVYHALVTTTAYRYIRWDADAPDLVPKYGPLGQLLGAVRRPVGNEIEEVVPGEYVYWDPGASDQETAAWCVVARVKPINWVQERFAKSSHGASFLITADSHVDGGDLSQDAGSVPTAASASAFGWGSKGKNGSADLSEMQRKDGVALFEYWERPNPKYPQGRCIVVGGKRVLAQSVWPYEKSDAFPLCGVTFKPNAVSPHGLGLVEQLIDCQATINKEWSRILARLDKDKRVVLIEELSRVGADAYVEQVDLAKLYYKPGSRPPAIIQPQDINESHFRMMEVAYGWMKDMSGVVDVLKGNAPPGVTAGITIDLLTQSAQQQIAPFITSIEQFAVSLAEWRIALGAQFVREERMIGLDESGTPGGMGAFGQQSGAYGPPGAAQQQQQQPPQGDPLMGVSGPLAPGQMIPPSMGPAPAQGHRPRLIPFAMKALTSGGMTAVMCTPGSATPRSPVGEKQELLELYNLALLGGPPGSPDAIRNYWRLAKSTYSSPMLAEMERIIAEIQAAAAQQAALEQAQAGAQGAAGQQAAQTAGITASASLEVAKLRAAAELEKTRLDGATKVTTSQLQANHTLALENEKHHARIREGIVSALTAHALPAPPRPIAPGAAGPGRGAPAGAAPPAGFASGGRPIPMPPSAGQPGAIAAATGDPNAPGEVVTPPPANPAALSSLSMLLSHAASRGAEAQQTAQ